MNILQNVRSCRENTCLAERYSLSVRRIQSGVTVHMRNIACANAWLAFLFDGVFHFSFNPVGMMGGAPKVSLL